MKMNNVLKVLPTILMSIGGLLVGMGWHTAPSWAQLMIPGALFIIIGLAFGALFWIDNKY